MSKQTTELGFEIFFFDGLIHKKIQSCSCNLDENVEFCFLNKNFAGISQKIWTSEIPF